MSGNDGGQREFCPHCGTERLSGRFCGGCGLDLTSLPAQPPQSFTARFAGISFATPEPSPEHVGAARRVSVFAIAGVLLLVLAGVGASVLALQGNTAAAPASAAATPAAMPAAKPAVGTTGSAPDCMTGLGAFVATLEDLDSRLDVGLTFAEYGTRVGDARVAYDRIKVAELQPDCVTNVGVPAEDAFNHYVKAFNTWNDCIGKLRCTNKKIRPRLQTEWAAASSILDQIKEWRS